MLIRRGVLIVALALSTTAAAQELAKTIEVPFKSHDGHEMFGKLTLPVKGEPVGLLIYVQTAEGATVDMKRRKSKDATFNYYDLYREKMSAMNVAFFSYEGRGIRMGDKPPRFETINWEVFNTSSLDNKVRDILSAIQTVREQPGCQVIPIFLIGASEGTLLAAEAAARAPKEVAGLVLYGVLTSNMRENFKYIMSDGAFLMYKHNFDTNGDGKVSKEEYDADPKKFRDQSALKQVAFEQLDVNKDGFFSVDDIKKIKTQVYLDAVDKDDFAVLQKWASSSAAVAVPKEWFKDHFAHQPIWSFLSAVDIPVGCFQGALDTAVPIEGVRELEKKAKAAGKNKMEFFYFDELDHSLNIGSYFVNGKMPAGHEAIFAFLQKQLKSRRRN